LVSVDVTSDGYAPAVGDPFTGSYTFNAVALSSVTGEFFEGAPAAVAADLEVDTLAATYPSASAPDGQEPSFSIVSTRARGYSGSSGTYAPPAFTTATIATTISTDRSSKIPTSDSRPTPRSIR